jgi:hypothetical protein
VKVALLSSATLRRDSRRDSWRLVPDDAHPAAADELDFHVGLLDGEVARGVEFGHDDAHGAVAPWCGGRRSSARRPFRRRSPMAIVTIVSSSVNPELDPETSLN